MEGRKISRFIDATKQKSHDTEGFTVFVSAHWVFLMLLEIIIISGSRVNDCREGKLLVPYNRLLTSSSQSPL
jgi:hypothetical protein